MRNNSYENDFDLPENETACRTHFHMNGFALRLVLKQRHKRTLKWPITLFTSNLSVLHCNKEPEKLPKLEISKRSVFEVRMGKSRPLECARLANHIQGLRIRDR